MLTVEQLESGSLQHTVRQRVCITHSPLNTTKARRTERLPAQGQNHLHALAYARSTRYAAWLARRHHLKENFTQATPRLYAKFNYRIHQMV